MAIARISDTSYMDPELRRFIHIRLKNLICITEDLTAPVKEYKFDHPDYTDNELVEIIFSRKNGRSGIQEIRPILNPEANQPKVTLEYVQNTYINPPVNNPSIMVERLRKMTEFLSACHDDFDLPRINPNPDPYEYSIYMKQVEIGTNRLEAFVDAYKIYTTPMHPNAPQEQPKTDKEYVVLEGRARKNRFFGKNVESRIDWYRRIAEVDTVEQAQAICGQS